MEALLLYLTGSVSDVGHLLDSGTVGLMNTPNIGYRVLDWIWAADNGCYGTNYVGDRRWITWLASFTAEQRARCLFATAPDVLGDAAATLRRSRPWLGRIRDMGYRAALVAQDGLSEPPWDEFDVLFIGGTTHWKLGPDCEALIAEAKRREKWVHVGRVNSRKRFLRFAGLGCDSSDGTMLAFGPLANIPRLLDWHEATRHLQLCLTAEP